MWYSSLAYWWHILSGRFIEDRKVSNEYLLDQLEIVSHELQVFLRFFLCVCVARRLYFRLLLLLFGCPTSSVFKISQCLKVKNRLQCIVERWRQFARSTLSITKLIF